MRTDFIVVCFPTALSKVITSSVPMHFSEVSSSSCISSLQTWLEINSSMHNFLVHFTVTARLIEDSRRFVAGSGAKLEICMNGLFFERALALTAHHFSVNKIECNYGLRLCKYFVNYTPGFKSKLFNHSKHKYKCFKKLFFLVEDCHPISLWIKKKKNLNLWRVQKDKKLNKEKMSW